MQAQARSTPGLESALVSKVQPNEEKTCFNLNLVSQARSTPGLESALVSKVRPNEEKTCFQLEPGFLSLRHYVLDGEEERGGEEDQGAARGKGGGGGAG